MRVDVLLPQADLQIEVCLGEVQGLLAELHKAGVEVHAEIILQAHGVARAHLLHGDEKGRMVDKACAVHHRVVMVQNQTFVAKTGHICKNRRATPK